MGKLQLDQSKAIIKKYFLAVFSTARASLVQIILPLQLSSQPFEKNLCVNCPTEHDSILAKASKSCILH